MRWTAAPDFRCGGARELACLARRSREDRACPVDLARRAAGLRAEYRDNRSVSAQRSTKVIILEELAAKIAVNSSKMVIMFRHDRVR